VEELIRKLVFEYVSEYVSGGNERLAVYRDSERPTFVATEFKSMIDRMPELDQHLNELKAYLLGYPRQVLPDATSFLYWQEVQFGLKPTIRVNHVVINNRPDGTAIASKMIYASHYFWTALDLRVLMPDPARARLLVRERQPKSIGRSERVCGPADPIESAERRAEGFGDESHGHEGQAGTGEVERFAIE
jgi:hypothetical protein